MKAMSGGELLFLLALSAAACVGCGSHESCTTTDFVAPNIVVTSASTGAPICNATVSYSAPFDDAMEQLANVPASDGGQASCVYSGLDLPGSYVLTIAAPGFQTTTASAEAGWRAGCGAAPTSEIVRVVLAPE